jgi:glutamine synthetase adenylyltransferase
MEEARTRRSACYDLKKAQPRRGLVDIEFAVQILQLKYGRDAC